ncbi:MAG: SAM-dependent methyltransferase [Desulfobacteraceae bacterium]|nr:SAM-dependent methyltransferase [Desulfobacteraceae bacterium]
MTDNSWTPGKILETSGYHWKTATLHAAVHLDLFSVLDGRQVTAREAAEACGSDTDGTERLLNALAAMGLINKNEEKYANTDAAQKYLSRHSGEYLGHIISHHHHLVPAWAQLDQAVAKGAPVRKQGPHADETQRRSFLMGMHNLARLVAPRVAAHVDLSGCRRLLDLGGGPGTHAIYFCLENPDLNAVVADLPATRPYAEENIAEYGLSGRIAFTPVDYTAEEIPGQYDAAWLSQILHGEGPEHCREILGKAVSSLVPGGKILVHEFILDNTRADPLFPALFSLNMLVNTDSGRAYSEQEITEMLSESGAEQIKRLDFCGPNDSGIIEGIAPRG